MRRFIYISILLIAAPALALDVRFKCAPPNYSGTDTPVDVAIYTVYNNDVPLVVFTSCPHEYVLPGGELYLLMVTVTDTQGLEVGHSNLVPLNLNAVDAIQLTVEVVE